MTKLVQLFGIFLFTILILDSENIKAQFGYSHLNTTDSLEISYKWSNSNIFDKNSSPQLRVKIKNMNKKTVQFNLQIVFFMNGFVKEESKIINTCIDSRKSVFGKWHGLVFVPATLGWSDIKSEDFSWEIADFTVKKLQNKCKK